MGRFFENRKQKIAKRADRDAKAFTRAGRQIAMAVRAGGPDPDSNLTLKRAMQNANSVSMPKDTILKAIDKAAGDTSSENYEEIIYEGYAAHGIALMVVTATDNPTRTVANVRFAFKKENGNLGTAGSVAFMFDCLGVFYVDGEGLDRDELELELIDHGLEDLIDGHNDSGDERILFRCKREEFGNLQAGLEAKGLEVESSGMEWAPHNTTELDDDQIEDVAKLIEKLEQDDDVQQVFHTLA